MLLKEIEKICKHEKSVIVYTMPNGSQWVGTGSALFPLDNLPKNLSMDAVLTLLNIPSSDLDKYYKDERTLNEDDVLIDTFLDMVEDETEITEEFPAVYTRGSLYNAYRISDGIMFVNAQFMKAFREKDIDYGLFERYCGNQKTPFLAVKRGLILDGIIFPANLCKDAIFCDALSNMATLCSLECGKNEKG